MTGRLVVDAGWQKSFMGCVPGIQLREVGQHNGACNEGNHLRWFFAWVQKLPAPGSL
jgi:hypothetical protein